MELIESANIEDGAFLLIDTAPIVYILDVTYAWRAVSKRCSNVMRAEKYFSRSRP